MAASMDQQTPPHHPTFNVKLSDAYITRVINSVFPTSSDVSVERLPRGKSFNNRIYFITVDDRAERRQLVLKANGRFWGANKVENEVSCLLLLQSHCPNVPAPQPIAWSPDGRTFCQLDERRSSDGIPTASKWLVAIDGNGNSEETEANFGWILMSRQPGETLDLKGELTDVGMQQVARQLATFVYDWRTKMPHRKEFGNMWFNAEPSEGRMTLRDPKIVGSVLWIHKSETKTDVKLHYVKTCFQDKLAVFKTNQNYQSAHQTDTVTLVEDFLRSDLAQLEIFSTRVDQSPRFTHNDFAPRNILVEKGEGATLKVTGFLDFEFAGFFPAEDEFTNLVNSNDWPAAFHLLFLNALADLGEEVAPISGLVDCTTIPSRQWEEVCLISSLPEDIAPWYLAEGGVKGEELEKELVQAANRVRAGIERLRQLLQENR